MLILFILVYLAVTVGISFYAHTKIQNSGDYINAGRGLPTYINSAAFFALWFGSETIFGASSEFVEGGFNAIIEDPFGGVLCLLLVGIFFARKLYDLNVVTIVDLFSNRFGRNTELVAALMMVFSFFGYTAAQMVALGLVISAAFVGFPLEYAILVGSAVVVFYIFWGGMLAVTLNDFVQSIMIVVGLVAIAIAVTDRAGGIGAIYNSIPDGHLDILPQTDGISITNWIAAWLTLGLGSIVSQDVFQRVNSSINNSVARKSTLYGAVLYGVFAMLPLYIVTAVKVLDPAILEGDLQMALPQLVVSTMPMILQILFFGSLISAILSTCSGAILAPATIISENILPATTDEKKILLRTRLAVIVVGIISTALAFGNKNIFELVGESSAFGLVSIFFPFCAILFKTGDTKMGIWISMIAGTTVWVLSSFVFQTEINPMLYGAGASFIGLIFGYFFEKIQMKVSLEERT